MDSSQKVNIAINRLDEMRIQGHDIKRALENATLGDWTSLWPAKDGNGTSRRQSVESNNVAVALGILKREEAKDAK